MSDQPKISIIILAYLKSNAHYFEACLASVKNLDYPPELLRVIVVSPWVNNINGVFITRPPEPGSFSKSVNHGFNIAGEIDLDSEFYLLLSDDTIITKDALKTFVDSSRELTDCLMGPLSNCDISWKYAINLPITGLQRYYKFGDENPVTMTTHMMNASSPITTPMILITDTLCFYAFFVKCSTWKKVGPLDETFNMGYEDTDWCSRAKNLNIPPLVNLNALIYHAGGQSAALITDEMRTANENHYHNKWASN